MAKPRLQDVLETMQVAVAKALTASSLGPTQVVVGWPPSTELVKILNAKQPIVTVYDRGTAKNVSRYQADVIQIAAISVPLVATVSGSTLTFSGTVAAGINVHTVVGHKPADAFYQTVAADTLASIATAVAGNINALAISGLTASASGAVVTVVGTPLLICNVTGSGLVAAQEYSRINRTIQVSVWAPDPMTRYAYIESIETQVGGITVPFLTLNDGTQMYVLYQTDHIVDDSQSSYSLYEAHLVYSVEYGVYRRIQGTIIGDVSLTEQVGQTISTVQIPKFPLR